MTKSTSTGNIAYVPLGLEEWYLQSFIVAGFVEENGDRSVD